MTDERVFRSIVFVVLLGALTMLFVLGGTGWPAAPDVGPDIDELAEDPEGYIGEEIETTGTVVNAEEALVELKGEEESLVLELEGIPTEELEEGLDVSFAGELTEDLTVIVEPHRFATREPWETAYMFIISGIGGLIAVAVGLNFWRFDRHELGFTPREQPLHQHLMHGGGMDG